MTLSFFGELNPDYGQRRRDPRLCEKDGKPIDGGIRLIVPGDKHGGRAVHDVRTIEVR